jgi:hypothetical protein
LNNKKSFFNFLHVICEDTGMVIMASVIKQYYLNEGMAYKGPYKDSIDFVQFRKISNGYETGILAFTRAGMIKRIVGTTSPDADGAPLIEVLMDSLEIFGQVPDYGAFKSALKTSLIADGISTIGLT